MVKIGVYFTTPDLGVTSKVIALSRSFDTILPLRFYGYMVFITSSSLIAAAVDVIGFVVFE